VRASAGRQTLRNRKEPITIYLQSTIVFLRPSGTVLAFVPPILLNSVLITIIHFNSLVQPPAILLSVPSALVGVVLGLLITGVPLGLMTSLVALTRIFVRVLCSVVFGVRQESATSTEPTPTPQPSRT
jgi:hypothetical protein